MLIVCLKRMCVLLGCLYLSACAINLSNVATFGDSMSSVAAETSTVLVNMPAACRQTLVLVSEQRRVVAAVQAALAERAKRPVISSEESAGLGNKQAHLTVFAQALETSEASLSDTCPGIESLMPALQGLSVVLSAYGSAIKSLAQDSFVTYNAELDVLPESLGRIPRPGHRSEALLTREQTESISALQKLLYEAAIHSYRQRKLEQVLDDRNRQAILAVVNALRQASAYYSPMLDIVQVKTVAVIDDARMLQREGLLLEPVGLQEFSIRMAGQAEAVKAKQDALRSYVALLDKVEPALDKTRWSLRNPADKELLSEVREFARTASEVERKLRKAF